MLLFLLPIGRRVSGFDLQAARYLLSLFAFKPLERASSLTRAVSQQIADAQGSATIGADCCEP